MNTISGSSTNIYEFDYDTILTDLVVDDILKQKFHYYSLHQYGHQFTAGHLDNDEKSSYYHIDLFNWFQSCINKVSAIHFPYLNLAICDSWLTRSDPNEYASRHTHTHSVFTGVFYLTTHEGSKLNLFFPDPISQKFGFLLGKDIVRETKISIAPTKGKLIIFPSDTPHVVDRHTSSETRYSLVFNTFFNKALHVKPNGMTMDTFRLTLDVGFNKYP
jgi:uncharacterized protein (TIGR02466 family)